MRGLSTLRQGWEEIEAEETRLLRELTIQESMSQLLALQQAFEPQLRQTEALFRADRVAYLEELQLRLRRHAEWLEKQERSKT